MKRKLITVIVPAYNEADNILRMLGHLQALADGKLSARHDMTLFDWDFLFVNDGSSDNTLQKLREARDIDPRVSILALSRNFGKEAALLAGLDYAAGDAVVIMDADLQHPADAIPRMVAEWQNGYQDVYGRRLTRGKESLVRKKLSLAFYRLLSKSSRFPILQNVGDFRLLDRKVVDAVTQLRETQRLNKGLFCWVGFRKTGIDFEQSDRTAGKSSFNLRRLTDLAIDGITSFTTSPLRISAYVGFVVALLAIAYAIYIFIKTCIYGDPVSGFPTLICVILFLGGLQLIALGIIGEYIGRIFMETKRRPDYIIDSFETSLNPSPADDLSGRGITSDKNN